MVFTKKRTWAQAMTWRMVALVNSLSVAWLVTRSAETSLKVAAIYTVVALVTHYAHDRAWLRVRWGFIGRKTEA